MLSALRSFPRIPWYRLLVRPFLFRLDPESAQRIADHALAAKPVWRLLAPVLPDTPLVASGIPLRNPIGLAAGLDKQCAYLDALGSLGFGYVVGGTVTLEPRPGNQRPRVRRIVHRKGLVNALGFPSDGLEAVAARLERLEDRPARVLVSIAVLDEDGTETCWRRLEPSVDAIELNISSPNTAGLRRFQEPEALKGVLERLNGVRSKPLFVKLPPYMDERERDNVLALARACREAGISGITAINTVPMDDSSMATGRGGLSGAPILAETLRILPELRSEIGSDMVLNACGGISSGNDAAQALALGADTVQLFTALVYEGPGLVARIVSDLARARGNS